MISIPRSQRWKNPAPINEEPTPQDIQEEFEADNLSEAQRSFLATCRVSDERHLSVTRSLDLSGSRDDLSMNSTTK